MKRVALIIFLVLLSSPAFAVNFFYANNTGTTYDWNSWSARGYDFSSGFMYDTMTQELRYLDSKRAKFKIKPVAGDYIRVGNFSYYQYDPARPYGLNYNAKTAFLAALPFPNVISNYIRPTTIPASLLPKTGFQMDWSKLAIPSFAPSSAAYSFFGLLLFLMMLFGLWKRFAR